MIKKRMLWGTISSTLALICIIIRPFPASAASLTPTVSDLLRRENIARASKHLPPLRLNSRLNAVAQHRIRDIIKAGSVSHLQTLPKSLLAIFRGYRYLAKTAGENIAENYPTGKQVLTAWLHSKTHRKNVYLPSYHDTGIAIQKVKMGQKTVILVVQEFGDPR